MLFLRLNGGQPMVPSHPLITTPFGELTTFCIAGALDSRQHLPTKQTVLPGGAAWRTWSTDTAVAELLIGPIAPALPGTMSVDGCTAAAWRVQARGNLADPAITSHWVTVPAGADGGPNPGEWLDAQTWDIGDAMVSLGTEDGEHMSHRARMGEHMPHRLAPLLGYETIDYLPEGIRVPFPPLEPGEMVQVHFIVAWTLQGAPDRVDTWFAVEQSPSEVLRNLGVRPS